MSSQDIITAYSVAVPQKQEQPYPGLDKNLAPGVEYTKLEYWDNEGNPSLREYQGVGKLQGKTAIITGGDSGIGRAAAIMFTREGCTGITITHLPEELEDAQEAKKMIEASGSRVTLTCLDLMEEQNCKALVEDHVRNFGGLNILVNNAAKQMHELCFMCKDFKDIDLSDVESTFKSNILQMFAVTKYALSYLKRGSAIINTASVVAYKGSVGMVDYSATKGAIVTFTRSLAIQLAKSGIRVNAVAPGPVVTALQAASRSADNMEEFGVGLPLHNRAAQPAEVGPAFVFLASSDSNAMTGAVLHINGGQHIGGS
ncbi:hypothetical protein AX16_000433 [Volvariella volvacea WC 439]|nr:hypothetical protein AX16_000433 [Volvariella volvacea WC 439]